MPFFDYTCKTCGETFEKLVRTKPGPSLLECPKCETLTATRQLSAFATIGAGRRSEASCAPSGGG